ncbi:MAG TPA: glycosyltransferase family 39 protein [Candidatus Sulfotelmatobacter sp.]|nr:glycosyltransferase family 39 protein [Candidatus Sulfotelmatobacter sp.]
MFTKKTLLNNLPLILIILLAFLLRFLWIDKVPNAIGGDELTYIVNARAIFLTGTDISGTWYPLSGFIFKYPAYTLPQAELPYFLIAPFVGLFGFSFFSARIIFVLLSALSVYLIYLITKTLFNKNSALFASLLTAINPWSIYMGRTSYEETPAIFFFLLSFYLLLVLKGRKILLTIPFLFLAFYSYVATKISFLPFVLVVVLFSYFFVNKKKYLREYLIVLASSVALFLIFALAVFTTKGPSRAGDLISFNSPQISEQVDYVRKISMPSPLTFIFENKFTIFSRIVLTKLFKSLSFDYLFVYGDQFYSILRHGFFYVLDALFLVLGFAYSYSLKKRAFFLLTSIALIGILPQIAHSNSTDNFSIHLSLMFAIFPIFIGVGISETLNLFKNRIYYLASFLVIGFLYLFLVLNFLNIYFFQFPLGGYFDFHVRLLSKYASVAKQEGKDIVVYSPNATDIFKKYIFYTNNYNKNTYLEIRKDYKAQSFKFQKVSFAGCDRTIDPTSQREIVVYDFNCGTLPKEYKHIAIPRLSDGGQSYQIFNDTVCKGFNLKRYPSNLSIADFAIEDMSIQKFCETYITSF